MHIFTLFCINKRNFVTELLYKKITIAYNIPYSFHLITTIYPCNPKRIAYPAANRKYGIVMRTKACLRVFQTSNNRRNHFSAKIAMWEEGVIILKSFTTALGEFLVARMSDMPEKPAVSFALPGAIAGKNALNLYFCSLIDDAELRSNETQYELRGTDWIARRPPLRLKCTYIVSAWPSAGNPQEAALSQMNMLSTAYSVIALSSTLPAAYLPEPMKATGLQRPVIAIEENPLASSPEFWTSAGCKFQPAFSFTATVSLPSTEEHFDNVVEGLQIDYKLGTK